MEKNATTATVVANTGDIYPPVGTPTLIEAASRYCELGISVIPIDKTNMPIGKWKDAQSAHWDPKTHWGFTQPTFYGIGLVAGKISGNIEVLDVDCKYDLTGTLFEDYKKAIFEINPDILKKLVVEKTRNNGYHLIYKCDTIQGNEKLANRAATDEEKNLKKEKVKVLIETRGEGGFIAIAPTPGYEFIYGSPDNIQKITPEERDVLFNVARTFTQHVDPIVELPKTKPSQFNGRDYAGLKSPFEDFNDRGDIVEFLLAEGWTQTGAHGKSLMFLRPGGDKSWSADYHTEKRLLYVFTTSSEFDQNKAYNHSQVLAILKFKKDYSATAKHLLNIGFGERRNGTSNNYEPPKIKITSECEFLADQKEMDAYLKSLRDGTFVMGQKTNIPELDEYFRFKESQLVVVNGMDNTGKSSLIWYMGVLSAIFYKWKWGILSAENKIGGIKRKLIEFYLCQHIKDMSEEDFKKGSKWVDDHFYIIANDELYSYKELLSMAKILHEKYGIKYCLIDPYNALLRDSENFHEGDYKAVSDMRLFIKQTGCGIYLNCHAVTNSLRREYPKDHKYHGFPYPPGKADTEGGGKFSNKADDFITCHRLTQHPHEWMVMQLHIRKIKEMETGGRPTPMDEPVLIEMISGGYGFQSVNSKTNPVLSFWGKTTQVVHASPVNFYETKKEEDFEF